MCRGCTGININEGFFQFVGEQGHLWPYCSFFWCNKGLCPDIIIFVYILIRREG